MFFLAVKKITAIFVAETDFSKNKPKNNERTC